MSLCFWFGKCFFRINYLLFTLQHSLCFKHLLCLSVRVFHQELICSLNHSLRLRLNPAMLNVDQMFTLLAEAGEGSPAPTTVCDAEEALALRDKALLELLYGSGLRISEALGLDVDDIRPGANALLVMGKGSKQRQVLLSDTCTAALSRWLEARAHIPPQRGELAL